jgi:antitoxin component of MazEF toxin-antitoxin module
MLDMKVRKVGNSLGVVLRSGPRFLDSLISEISAFH